MRLGADILVGVELTSATLDEDGRFVAELTGGGGVRADTGIVATGVHYRRLDAPGVDELVGAGVYYGSSPADARSTATATSLSPARRTPAVKPPSTSPASPAR